jgi:hypothetical protein
MKATTNTTVRDYHGTVIAGSDDSLWIAVHPADPLDTLFVEVCSRSIAPELDHKAEGLVLAAFSGSGDDALHAAMVDDSCAGIPYAFFYWDDTNGTWWRVGLVDVHTA